MLGIRRIACVMVYPPAFSALRNTGEGCGDGTAVAAGLYGVVPEHPVPRHHDVQLLL